MGFIVTERLSLNVTQRDSASWLAGRAGGVAVKVMGGLAMTNYGMGAISIIGAPTGPQALVLGCGFVSAGMMAHSAYRILNSARNKQLRKKAKEEQQPPVEPAAQLAMRSAAATFELPVMIDSFPYRIVRYEVRDTSGNLVYTTKEYREPFSIDIDDLEFVDGIDEHREKIQHEINLELETFYRSMIKAKAEKRSDDDSDEEDVRSPFAIRVDQTDIGNQSFKLRSGIVTHRAQKLQSKVVMSNPDEIIIFTGSEIIAPVVDASTQRALVNQYVAAFRDSLDEAVSAVHTDTKFA